MHDGFPRPHRQTLAVVEKVGPGCSQYCNHEKGVGLPKSPYGENKSTTPGANPADAELSKPRHLAASRCHLRSTQKCYHVSNPALVTRLYIQLLSHTHPTTHVCAILSVVGRWVASGSRLTNRLGVGGSVVARSSKIHPCAHRGGNCPLKWADRTHNVPFAVRTILSLVKGTEPG
jgi:hypothetical protein